MKPLENMNSPVSCLLIAILLMAAPPASLHAEIRTFTSAAGTTLRGEFLSVDGDSVIIKKEDGSTITLKATALSRVDQAWLQGQGEQTAASPAVATKDVPFINSLGMKFVPVPETTALMCIHETRRKDYAAYAAADSKVNGEWKKAKMLGKPVSEGDNDPVVSVSWEDARAFCEWLGKKEGKPYRLPTDREWSIAVGIGDREQANGSPQSLSQKLKNVYPWGTTWPIPQGAGNYYDTTNLKMFRPKKTDDRASMTGFLDGFGYTDGFVFSAPVMSFTPNPLGIYDLGGNVWELVEDQFSPVETDIVFRGSSYGYDGPNNMLSSARVHLPKDARASHAGFRVVLELAQPPARP